MNRSCLKCHSVNSIFNHYDLIKSPPGSLRHRSWLLQRVWLSKSKIFTPSQAKTLSPTTLGRKKVKESGPITWIMR